jgi:hypothetical protein
MTLGFLDRLHQRSAPAAPAEFDGPSQVRAYWEGLRNASGLPLRAELDPRGLGGVLDRVFLAERIGKGLVQVRVAGSALTELCGTDLRGLPLSCLFTPESRPVLALALEEVFAAPAVAEIDLGSDRDRTGLAVARLQLLPLEEEAECRQLLGVIGFRNGLAASKLQILARRSERLILPSRLAEAAIAATTPAAPLAGPVTGRQRHLRLVHFSAE